MVLNAPDGAMWVREFSMSFYKYDHGFMFMFSHGKWSQCSEHNIIEWNKSLIPLPNVNIPWEATKDSVSPVPSDCRVLIWVDNATEPTGGNKRTAGISRWNLTSALNITSYMIIDEDYMREESEDNKDDLPYDLVGKPIIISTHVPELINKLQILSDVRERFPLIAGCAKAAMERLVERWVDLN